MCRQNCVYYMPRPVTASAVSLLRCLLPTQAAELLSTPTVPAACAATASAVFKQSNIVNFDLNYDLIDTEIEEAKEEDTSTDLFD